MKKIIITIVVFIIAIFAGIGACFYFKKNHTITTVDTSVDTVVENGFSFSYPKNLSVQHNFYGSFDTPTHKTYILKHDSIDTDQSIIHIAIPVSNNKPFLPSLEEDVKEDARYKIGKNPPKFESVNINGHRGEGFTYELDFDSDYGADHAKEIKIHLDSQYPNAPVELWFIRLGSDPSLDEAWSKILETLKY